MSRGRAKFTQAEIRRVKKVAGNDSIVEILTDGTIRLIPISAKPPEAMPFDTREPLVF